MADNDVFVVETILDSRLDEDGASYFVKWLDYDDTHNSWVAVADMNCPELLATFETQRYLALVDRVRLLEHRSGGLRSSTLPTSHDNSVDFVLPDSTTGSSFDLSSTVSDVGNSHISCVEVVAPVSSRDLLPGIISSSSSDVDIDHSFLSDADSIDEDFLHDNVSTNVSIPADVDGVPDPVDVCAPSSSDFNATLDTTPSISIFPPPFGVKLSSGKYTCDWTGIDGVVCGKVLSTRSSINRHVDRVHLHSGTLQCCNLVFPYYGALKLHQRDKHSI